MLACQKFFNDEDKHCLFPCAILPSLEVSPRLAS